MRTNFGTRDRSPGCRVRCADRQLQVATHWRARLRRGISLLEVLFAVFILSMGMLGLGALIPVANFQVSQGLRSDHSAACARAAFRHIEAGGLLNSDLWKNIDGDPPNFITNNAAQWPTFMLDPLFRARGGEDIYPKSGGMAPTMGRLTLTGMVATGTNDEQRQAVARAESIFRWRDDLPGGSGGERPVLKGDVDADSIWPHEGNYSWMAMVTPSPLESTVAAKLSDPSLAKRLTYTVAVIVFYKREIAADTNKREFPRNVAQFEAETFIPTTLTLMLDSAKTADTKIVPGQWIMLSHRISNGSGVGASTIPYHRWYRVVSAGNRFRATTSATNIPLHVQLEGPAWPVNVIDTSFRAVDKPTVTVHQGVVGVYEKTLEFDPRR